MYEQILSDAYDAHPTVRCVHCGSLIRIGLGYDGSRYWICDECNAEMAILEVAQLAKEYVK